MPSRGIQASNLHYMIWHCVPLHNEGTISLSGNLQRGNPNSVSITERERLDSSMPNNRRGGWALQCQNNRRSLLSLSRPMIPDPINLKRILSTNNCRLAIRQLSSRDGTQNSVSCNAHIFLLISHPQHFISQSQISLNISISFTISFTTTQLFPTTYYHYPW